MNEYDCLIFTDQKKKKEWDETDKETKDYVINNILKTCEKMENKIAIEILCNVVNELNLRLKKLEDKLSA